MLQAWALLLPSTLLALKLCYPVPSSAPHACPLRDPYLSAEPLRGLLWAVSPAELFPLPACPRAAPARAAQPWGGHAHQRAHPLPGPPSR